MIALVVSDSSLFMELYDEIRLFWSSREVASAATLPECGEAIEVAAGPERVDARYYNDGQRISEQTQLVTPGRDEIEQKRYYRRAAKLCIYYLLRGVTGIRPPWGALTGIRPTKLYHQYRSAGLSKHEIQDILIRQNDVMPQRARLLEEIAHNQGDTAPRNDEVDLYIAVPFCTTRCLYCSFASQEMTDIHTYGEAYLCALEQEMRAVAGMLGKPVIRSVYIGGGTPTALPPELLDRLLEQVRACFGWGYEFTVEAGRPDSISCEKALCMQRWKVGRTSINPQTMHDVTLEAIGRKHTAKEVYHAFDRMRGKVGIINMDIIAGLPGETPRMLLETLRCIEQMQPDNLTVHTLAVKRSSRLHDSLGQYRLPEADAVQRMIQDSECAARRMGMQPYYLYRQKQMTGNFENIGYCKAGMACLYNIDIMEEIRPVVAMGAGAISKWLYPEKNRIERQANAKHVPTYIARVNEWCAKKKEALEQMWG